MPIDSLGDARYGMFVHANIASVPGFSPVHEYADWYWSHLEPKADVVLHPTSPLPEVMAWHREHYGDAPFDDFIPQLTFERFDADAYAQLAEDAGMRYVVHVTKHHDGFCWWDASHTDRNSVKLGPKRDVVAELAAATRAHGLVFGTYYSLLDWAHPAYPDQAGYVDAFLHPQIVELAERFQPAVIWGDGHWGHTGAHWRADALVDAYLAVAERLGFAAAVNDRFFASHADFRTYEYDVPEHAPEGAWELCRGLGYSFCWNRTERDDDHLTARQIVAMLVETVAKGGNLLLNVGPYADGTVPDIQVRVLRDAGEWVRANADAIHGSEPFVDPGTHEHWYTVTPGAASDGRTRVNAVDLAASGQPVFAALGAEAGRVQRVVGPDGREVDATQTDHGLVVDARAEPVALAACYRIDLEPRPTGPVRVRDTAAPGTVTRNGDPFPCIADALLDAAPGDVVEVTAGRYSDATERFPLVIPAGVTLRAAPGTAATAVVIDSGGAIGATLTGDEAKLLGVSLVNAAAGYMMIPPTCVTIANASYTEVRDCHVESIGITGGAGHRIERNVVSGGNIWAMFVIESTIASNFQHGLRWGAGIEVRGGRDNTVEHNECRDDLCAIRVAQAGDIRVVRNRYETRWFGVHVHDARNVLVRRNQAWRTMRAVNVEGGTDVTVEKNLAEHCDTGVLVERDATNTVVAENWLHDCRVGVLCWDDRDTKLRGNAMSEPREHAVVTNTPLHLDGNDLGGSDVWSAP
jgi:alpha-L-fucosidase